MTRRRRPEAPGRTVALQIRIVPVRSARRIAPVQRIFREYSRAVGEHFRWEGFEEEVRSLPGPYRPPTGSLLLARAGRRIVGMVATRPWSGATCEMKRLYVRPSFRSLEIGRKLSEAILREARALGYRRMRLDTLDWMKEARTLYRSLGFRAIPPYLPSPGAKAHYLELRL